MSPHAAWSGAIATVVARRLVDSAVVDERHLAWWDELDEQRRTLALQAARIRRHDQKRQRELRRLREIDPRLRSSCPVTGRRFTARELAARLRRTAGAA